MTRMDSVRAATGSARESVLHAADVVAPYADQARDRASHYARVAKLRVGPKLLLAAEQAREQARDQYDSRLAPRIDRARTHVPPKVDEAALHALETARHAADVARPRIEQAMAAAGPASRQATDRGTAAVAALRGQITAKDVQKIVRRRARRAKAGRAALGALAVGVLAGGAFAAWKWWDRQANPDWLVEPPAPTEVPDDSRGPSLNGSGAVDAAAVDPDVAARQTEAKEAERIAHERRTGRGK